MVTLLIEASSNGTGASDGRGLGVEEHFARSGMVAEAREPRKDGQESCNGGAIRGQLQHGIQAT